VLTELGLVVDDEFGETVEDVVMTGLAGFPDSPAGVEAETAEADCGTVGKVAPAPAPEVVADTGESEARDVVTGVVTGVVSGVDPATFGAAGAGVSVTGSGFSIFSGSDASSSLTRRAIWLGTVDGGFATAFFGTKQNTCPRDVRRIVPESPFHRQTDPRTSFRVTEKLRPAGTLARPRRPNIAIIASIRCLFKVMSWSIGRYPKEP
jgi:hypothetical protein